MWCQIKCWNSGAQTGNSTALEQSFCLRGVWLVLRNSGFQLDTEEAPAVSASSSLLPSLATAARVLHSASPRAFECMVTYEAVSLVVLRQQAMS